MAIIKKVETPMEKVNASLERRLAYLNNIMVVVCDFSNGPMKEPDKPHSHPHEQITYIAEGELFFFLGDEKHHLGEGDIFTVPSDVPHCIQTLSRTAKLIDCFTPVREDFIK